MRVKSLPRSVHAERRRLLLFIPLLIVTVLSLPGCVTRASTQATRIVAAEVAQGGRVEVGETARTKCEPAPLPMGVMPTPDDYRMFGIAQTLQLRACEERRASALRTIEAHNASVSETVKAVGPRPWWQFWKQ